MSTPNDNVVDTLREGARPVSGDLRDRILAAVATEPAATEPTHHLAQMNIARFNLPMDHPDMGGFVEMLDPINHLADSAPGFVWRLTDEGSNNATSIAFYDDPLLLLNMSVWTDVASLRDYVYRTTHSAMVKRREEWAKLYESHYLVLWWVPAGHTPDIREGDARLKLLEANGPTAEAFTFGQSFSPPDA